MNKLRVFYVFFFTTVLSCNTNNDKRIYCLDESACNYLQLDSINHTLLKYVNVPLKEDEILSLPKYFHALLGGASLISSDNDFRNYGVTCFYGENNLFIIMFNGTTQNERRVLFDFKVIKISNFDSTKTVSYQVCYRNNKLDSSLVALVETHDEMYHEPAYLTWYADVKTRKLMSVSSKGVKCGNEGY